MYRTFIVFVLLLIAGTSFAQFGGDNWMEYRTYDLDGEDGDKDEFKDILNLLYSWEDLSVGVRLELFYPYEQENIRDSLVHKYVAYEPDNFSILVGSFYQIFGNGIILNSFELLSASVGGLELGTYVDRNINGFRASYDGDWASLTGIAGQMNSENDVGTVKGFQLTLSPYYWITFGGAYLASFQSIRVGSRTLHDDVELSSVFFDASLADALELDDISWTMSAEYARKWPSPDPDEDDGRAFFGSSGFNWGPIGLVLQYKKYWQMEYYTGSAPTAVPTRYFTLLNRHTHKVEFNDEIGYYLELSYTFEPEKQFILGLTRADNDARSDLYRYKNWYFEFDWLFGDLVKTRSGFDYAEDPIEGNDIQRTIFTENEIYLTDTYTIILGYEYQTIVDPYEDDPIINRFLELSFLSSPKWSLSYLGETSSMEEDFQNPRRKWQGLNASYKIGDNHDLSMFYGVRRGGTVCSGGYCVTVPAFSGIELRLISSF